MKPNSRAVAGLTTDLTTILILIYAVSFGGELVTRGRYRDQHVINPK